jgi:hypothetical protein
MAVIKAMFLSHPEKTAILKGQLTDYLTTEKQIESENVQNNIEPSILFEGSYFCGCVGPQDNIDLESIRTIQVPDFTG